MSKDFWCIRVKVMGSHDKEDGDGMEDGLRLPSFLHHQPEVQHVSTEAAMDNMLNLPLKIYYCVWSVIKPKKTSQQCIHSNEQMQCVYL